MSFAVIPWESPDITKKGHSEMWTASFSSAAIAKVTEGSSLEVLHSQSMVIQIFYSIPIYCSTVKKLVTKSLIFFFFFIFVLFFLSFFSLTRGWNLHVVQEYALDSIFRSKIHHQRTSYCYWQQTKEDFQRKGWTFPLDYQVK